MDSKTPIKTLNVHVYGRPNAGKKTWLKALGVDRNGTKAYYNEGVVLQFKTIDVSETCLRDRMLDADISIIMAAVDDMKELKVDIKEKDTLIFCKSKSDLIRHNNEDCKKFIFISSDKNTNIWTPIEQGIKKWRDTSTNWKRTFRRSPINREKGLREKTHENKRHRLLERLLLEHGY